MPKEYIYDRWHGRIFTELDPTTNEERNVPAQSMITNQVKVGWSRETGLIQIATVNPEGETVCSGGSSDPRDLKIVSKELHELGVLNINRDEKTEALYREWISALEFEPDCRNIEGGFYVDLDRNGINDLIRVLRRARDQALGRDE